MTMKLKIDKQKFIRVTKELVESLHDSDYNLLVKFKEPELDEDSVLLYHETTKDKLKIMLKEGIKLSKALKENGSCIWASNKLEDSNNWMYGDFAICFKVNKNKCHKVNQLEYQVYQDIPVSDFIAIYVMTHRTEMGKEKLLKELELKEDFDDTKSLYDTLNNYGFKFSYTPSRGASYLMRDGKFLNMQDNEHILDPLEETGKATHPDLDYYLYDKGIVGDEDEANRILIKTDNAIRLNDGTNFENEMAVISLPENPLTEAQYSQLEEWLYKVMYLSKNIDVGDEVTDKFDTYTFSTLKNDDGVMPSDIIKEIRKRYKKVNEKYYPQPKKTYDFNDEDKSLTWDKEAEDYIYWSSEADKWAEDYAKFYKVKMSPKDFLDLTTVQGADKLKKGDRLALGELRDLDKDELNRWSNEPIYLNIAFRDRSNNNIAQVIGHEGRHRMFALWQAGYNKIDVELNCEVWNTEYDKYHPYKLDKLTLIGQFNKDVRVQVYNPIPLSWKNHKAIRPDLKDESLNEKIVKKGNKWQVQSEKGKNLGTYDTEKEAKNRLKQVHYFKHVNESYDNYLYHATFKKYWDEIQKSGHIGGSNYDNWGFSNKNVVCLANDPELAYSFCESVDSDYVSDEVYKSGIVILKIDTSKLDKDKLRPDNNITIYDNGIEVDDDEYIECYEYEDRIPLDAVSQVIEEKLNLKEKLLTEKRRSELISKSKSSDNYAISNQYRGRNRWERRKYSRISTSVADYNKIDMNAFWKGDILEFGIKVQGETDNYVVTVLFENILKRLRDEVQRNKNKLEFKCILRALIQTFNSEDVYIHCSCPDFTYRQAYWATKGNYNSGTPQYDPGKGIANPNDTKGAGCKHVNLILANMTWMMKIASVINNYIWYCKDNMELNYAQYIFPQIFGMDYDKAIQLTLFDTDELNTDEEIINLSNALGRRRTQFKPKGVEGGNPRFERPKVEREDPNQIKLDLEEPTDEVGIENEEEVDNDIR